jgi:hypothetical protein
VGDGIDRSPRMARSGSRRGRGAMRDILGDFAGSVPRRRRRPRNRAAREARGAAGPSREGARANPPRPSPAQAGRSEAVVLCTGITVRCLPAGRNRTDRAPLRDQRRHRHGVELGEPACRGVAGAPRRLAETPGTTPTAPDDRTCGRRRARARATADQERQPAAHVPATGRAPRPRPSRAGAPGR